MLSKGQQVGLDKLSDFLTDGNSDNKYYILQGHSGCGKTYLVSEVIENVKTLREVAKFIDPTMTDAAYADLPLLLAASTHKAAKVLSKRFPRYDVRTIHSILGLRVFTDYKTGKQTINKTKNSKVLHNKTIFIDEASMLDLNLLQIIDELTVNCKIVFIGDKYQLAPVMQTSSPVFEYGLPSVELDEIQRQKGDNSIIELGDKLRHTVQTGKFFPLEPSKNIVFLDAASFQDMLIDSFQKQTDIDDTRFLAWTNKRVNEVNDFIRDTLVGSDAPTVGESFIFNAPLMGADKILFHNEQVVTLDSVKVDSYMGIPVYEVKVQDVQFFMIKDREAYNKELKYYKKNKMWLEFYAIKENIADLRPPFACTVHKSQGSTFKDVFIDLNDIGKCHKWNDVARMLYVAITRASGTVYLFGQLPYKYQ